MSRHDGLPDYIIERNRAQFGTFSWEGQAPQYDQLGPPNELVYRRYFDGRPLRGEGKATIDTLLHYDEHGHLDGILNTYPFGAANTDGNKLDDPGNSTITIRPDQDTPDGGVRNLLVADARRRWPTIVIDVTTEIGASSRARTGLATTSLDQFADLGGAIQDGNRRTPRLPNPIENV